MTCNETELMALGMGAQLAQAAGFSCGTVAATGTTIADAATVTEVCLVTNADGTKGVKLPCCDVGKLVWIRNGAASALKVYANSSSEYIYIMGSATRQAGSTALSISAHYNAVFVKVLADTWMGIEVVAAV